MVNSVLRINFFSQKVGAIFIGALSVLVHFASAQDSTIAVKYSLSLDSTCHDKFLLRSFALENLEEQECADLERSLVTELYALGYLVPTRKESVEANHTKVVVSCGKSYKWLSVRMDEFTEAALRKAGVNTSRLKGSAFNKTSFDRVLNKPLIYLENNGFPFAEIYLDSVEISDNNVSARLVLKTGDLITIDSVVVNSDFEVRKNYIANYLGIKEGSKYDESAIVAISSKLKDATFFSESQTPRVYFNEDETKLMLYLKSDKASRFDGIIGFLPDANTGKLLVTGDASIHLENALKQGEEIDVKWQKLQTSTQDLRVNLVAPYLLNTPITADFFGNIYRRDTTFADVIGEAGVRYVLRQNNFFRAFINRKATSLISTNQYLDINSPPQYLDRTLLSYGLGAKFMKLDYRLNPTKGYLVTLDGAFGNRKVIVNDNLPKAIYDQLDLVSLQFSANIDASYYVSPFKRVVWHQQLMASSLTNPQLFNNDATRIGGFKTLRGFNEQAIYATSYAILRNEMRYQFERDGYAFAFFDGAWYENQSIDPIGARRDTPYGFGAGFSFGTKAGIFSISYALGSQQKNPILFRNNKIHFGFVSVF